MNYKKLSVILFFLLLGLNVNASLLNGSFEIPNSDFNSGAADWNYMGSVGQLCQALGFGGCNPANDQVSGLRTYQADANHGSYVIDSNNMGIADVFYLTSDLNFSTIDEDVNVCMSIRKVSGVGSSTFRFVVWDPVTSRISWWGQTPNTFGYFSSIPVGSGWREHCRPYFNNAKNYLFAIYVSAGTSGEVQIDNVRFAFPLSVDILNGTPTQAIAGDSVILKAKLLAGFKSIYY